MCARFQVASAATLAAALNPWTTLQRNGREGCNDSWADLSSWVMAIGSPD